MATRSKLNMMFYVKRTRPLKNGGFPIYVRIGVNRSYQDVSIGIGINDSLWHPGTGMAIGKAKEVKNINDFIDKIKSNILGYYRQMIEEGKVITACTLKDAWLGKTEADLKTIIGMYKEHNAKAKQLVGKDFAPATIQRYETSLKHVQDFIRLKYHCQDLPLYRIKHDFITGLEHYLKTERKCGHNSALKYIKNFKKIVKIALANGWMQADPFANYKMQLKKVDRGFLDEVELNRIMKKEFEMDRLAQVRDIFMFGCYTGLSYSDLKQLTPDNLIIGSDGKNWIFTKRQKTDNSCHIPVLPAAQEILDRYKENDRCQINNVLLPVLSNQKMNAYLKEIGTLCEIKKEISSHLARHTFATTITLNNDIPIESVSKMLGHSSINMTRIYARLLDKKISSDMSKLYEKY